MSTTIQLSCGLPAYLEIIEASKTVVSTEFNQTKHCDECSVFTTNLLQTVES